MNNGSHRVSIGLPVYNGEAYLRDALDALLRQTFEDFEIIVSDNASSDTTGEIARDYAEKDPRIRYYRNDENIGAADNFNRVFALAKGEYFKWAAHDDICAPDFLLRCVEALDRDPGVSVCYPYQVDIDDRGEVIGHNPYGVDTGLTEPHKRYADVMHYVRGAPAIWGLMRADILRRTPLIGKYYASDLVLLAELALYGRFFEVPEELLMHRDHARRSVYTPSQQSFVAWLDPKKKGKVTFPTWRLFLEYSRSVGRARISWPERIRCWVYTVKWLRWNWPRAVGELTSSSRDA